jgi:hypothetical protein
MPTPTERFLAQALRGQTLAAADSLLVGDEWIAALADVTEKTALAALEAFPRQDRSGRWNLAHALLRLGMNLVGAEAGTLKLDPAAAAKAAGFVGTALAGMEKADRDSVRGLVDAVLVDMRSVNAGDSLPALLAEEIAPEVSAAESAGPAFLTAFGRLADACVYTRMSRERYAKFGNDYARGLEYLRHVGYVQVSTNPVLAAKAFDEDPKLVEEFRSEAGRHPEWAADPEKHGDEMALRATLIALWPNLTVFRPLALRAANTDYMVSFQLNPNIADRAEESLEDARSAYKQASAFLSEYDKALGSTAFAGVRPCIVFKVAGSHAACRTITRELNADGIGTNNTVVYSVGQEVRLILDAFEGKARAVKAGKPVTRTYETNMGGRFTSHLREVEAEKIALAAGDRGAPLLAALAAAVKADPASGARNIVSFKYLKTLDHPAFLELARAAGRTDDEIRTLESDLRKAGTLVARRVWGIFYAPAHRPKWVAWLSKTYGVTAEQAKVIHESMDVLPASKRIVEDTLHALGYPNMCHTEFPNHARAVELAARKPGFQLSEFADSLSSQYPPEVVQRLSKLPDFVRGYELTAELSDLIVQDVGIAEAAGYGRGGVTDAEWPTFGPVVKTGGEFREAYDKFVARCIQIATGA